MRFGELTVLYDSGERLDGGVVWTAKCSCGNVTNVKAGNLKSGNTISCGHLRGEHNIEKWTTHGYTNIPEYYSWCSMKARCSNPNKQEYNNYGGRDIAVCDRWLNSFENFYTDMGPKPSEDHSIDRYPNNDGNYEPGNCRWATQEEQGNNRRTNVIVNYKDKEYTIAQLSQECGIEYGTLQSRLKRGWSAERSVETPSK